MTRVERSLVIAAMCVALAVAAAAAAGGCGRKGNGAAAHRDAGAAGASALDAIAALPPPGPPPGPIGDELGVTVLDAGAAPRRALRFAAEVGPRAAFTLDIAVDGVTRSSLMPQPSPRALHLRYGVEAVVEQVEGGHARVDLRTTAVELIGKNREPGLDDKRIAELRHAHAILDATGRQIAIATFGKDAAPWIASLERVPTGTRPMRDLWFAAVQTLLATMPTWPSEPIGVGARWRVERPLVLLGVHCRDVVTFELLAQDGDRARLRVTSARTADPQEVRDPVRPELVTNVRVFTGSGTGEIEVALARPWPLSLTREQTSARTSGFRLETSAMPTEGMIQADEHVVLTVAAAPAPAPPAGGERRPRSDGAYCARVSSHLACRRFLANHAWMPGSGEAQTPAELTWPAQTDAWRWSSWGDELMIIRLDKVSEHGTIAADASWIETAGTDGKKTRYRFLADPPRSP